MARKGMRSLFFRGSSSTQTKAVSSPSSSSFSSSSSSSSSPVIFDRLSRVEAMVTKWDPNGTGFAKTTSLFAHSREEARSFLLAVSDLKHLMNHFMTEVVTSSHACTAKHDLVRAHRLMSTAVKRLRKEFETILSSTRDKLDGAADGAASVASSTPTCLSDAEEDASEGEESNGIEAVERLPAAVMLDLRSIANCMVSTGHAKECVEMYRTIRKSIVEEGIYRLGFERLNQAQIKKLDSAAVEQRIEKWLSIGRVVVETLFSGERALCDYFFRSSSSSSARISDSCFADIAAAAAAQFMEFPELVAGRVLQKCKKKSFSSSSSSSSSKTKKMYRLLDLHNCVTDLLPEIETIFSSDATSAVRDQAASSLWTLGSAVRSMIDHFETTIQKDDSRGTSTDGAAGGLHPLTRSTMNNLARLSDYIPALTDIYEETDVVSAKFAWLVLVLLCKLDTKAEHHNDMALSYLFLANNLRHVVGKVTAGKNLRGLLGEEWVRKHEEKGRTFAGSYKRVGWGKVEAALEKEDIGTFNEVFRETCRVQSEWAAADGRTREELIGMVGDAVVPAYRELYEKRKHGAGGDDLVRYAPEDVERSLSELFRGRGISSVSSLSSPEFSSRSSSPSMSSYK